MELRSFNSRGIEAFRDWLAKCRDNPALEVERRLLEDSELTESIIPRIELSASAFVTKEDAARFLHDTLRPLPEDRVAKNAGLWSWLSLFFFDSICPPVEGNRFVRSDSFYIFAAHDSRHYYRHLLFISWEVMRVAPNHNRLMLCSPVNILDNMTDRVMQRLYVTRIPCIFEVLDRLYWDKDAGRPKRGVASDKPKKGDLRHRLPIRIRQLEKTYDLYSLNADQLLELLGEEFAAEAV